MRRRRSTRAGRSPVAVGAVVLGVLAVLVFLGFTKAGPLLPDGYTVKAAFRDSSGIKKGSPVRIAGVDVGKVTMVEREGRAALVTMAIADRGRPIGKDATMKVRPRIFLEGNFFVDIAPGRPGAGELPDGGTVPVEQTANAVQLDEVLATLTTSTRKDLRRLLSELNTTREAGGARGFNDALRFQPQAFRFSAIAADALLGQRPGDLGRAIGSTAGFAAALDASPQQLQRLIVSFDQTTAALAAQQDDLRAAVGELPTTLRTGLTAMAALNDAFPDTRRFARAAVPAVEALGPAARALTPLTRELRGLLGTSELRGLLGDLRAATPALAGSAKDLIPALEQVRLLASCTDTVLVPFGNDKISDPNFPATGPVHQEAAKFLPGLAGESRSLDANNQWFKVLGAGGPETFALGNGLLGTGAGPLSGVNPPYDTTRPPLRPDVPCETQPTPDLRTQVQDAPRSRTVPKSVYGERLAKAAKSLAEHLTDATDLGKGASR